MEAKDSKTMTLDELMENMKTYEMRKLQNKKECSPKKRSEPEMTPQDQEYLVERIQSYAKGVEVPIISSDNACLERATEWRSDLDKGGRDQDDENVDDNQSLMAKEEESDKILILMANSDSNFDDDNGEIFSETKDDIHTCSR
ncbi:hypothetical protein HAX54_003847 [Datura stramonium]|uniref:Uncharacterized protein n=1 Tax=Datura stramonium TaxID=4076 RepID=A0ABS8T7I6_DATST|nr:hypothetical protein [Datura stramonium]